jgi:hypothetical protein
VTDSEHAASCQSAGPMSGLGPGHSAAVTSAVTVTRAAAAAVAGPVGPRAGAGCQCVTIAKFESGGDPSPSRPAADSGSVSRRCSPGPA